MQLSNAFAGSYQHERQELINRFNTAKHNNNIIFVINLNYRVTAFNFNMRNMRKLLWCKRIEQSHAPVQS